MKLYVLLTGSLAIVHKISFVIIVLLGENKLKRKMKVS